MIQEKNIKICAYVAHEESNRETQTHTKMYIQKNGGRRERQRKDRASKIAATTKNNSFCPPFWFGTTKAHTYMMFLFLFFSFFFLLLLPFFFVIYSLFFVFLYLCMALLTFSLKNKTRRTTNTQKKTIIEKQRLMYETQCIIHASFFSARPHIETSGFTALSFVWKKIAIIIDDNIIPCFFL